MAEDKIKPEELSESLQKRIIEEFPYPLNIESEEIVNKDRNHNVWIVIGRDRPAGEESGFGQYPKKFGGDKCSSLDIVAGRYSRRAETTETNQEGKKIIYNRKLAVGNNIQEDAARIYISQKTDIDKNFLIEKAGTLNNSVAKSAIGMKADAVRIVAREGVKIVANSGDPYTSHGTRTNAVKTVYGIELITGFEVDPKTVQPIAKTDNLVQCLNEILDWTSVLAGQLNDFIFHQQNYNSVVAAHEHKGAFNSTFAGTVDIVQPFDLISAKQNLTTQVNKITRSIDSIRNAYKLKIPKDYFEVSQPQKDI